MKKWMSWLLALMLLWTAAGAFAETAAAPDLYDLYEETENGLQWVCTAVPMVDGVAMISPAGLPEELNSAVIRDGSAFRTVDSIVPVADGTLMVVLFETDGENPDIPAYEFLQAGRDLDPEGLMVRSGDALMSRINRAVTDISVITWMKREALLLTLSGDTTPGAPLVTADGELAGIVAAEYAEGANRYVALPVGEITVCLREAAELLDLQEGDNRPEGYTVTVEGSRGIFDWSQVELPEAPEGQKWFHVIADFDSTYLTYLEVTPGLTQQEMFLAPGRLYISGLGLYSDTPSEMPDQLAMTWTPEAEKMTDHQFRSITLAVAELQPGAAADAMPVVPEKITEEMLRSGRACLYSVSSYSVEEKIDNETLLVTLTAPDGNIYHYESGWYYDPAIMERDEWYTTMDNTGLLEMLNRNGYPRGTYELSMYIDGKCADTFVFELTE